MIAASDLRDPARGAGFRVQRLDQSLLRLHENAVAIQHHALHAVSREIDLRLRDPTAMQSMQLGRPLRDQCCSLRPSRAGR